MKLEKNNNLKSNIIYLILSVLGGMIGAFAVFLYLINSINIDAAIFPAHDSLKNIVRKAPEKLVVEQDAAYGKILKNAEYGIVDIYDTSKQIQNTSLTREVAGALIVPVAAGDIAVTRLIYPEQFIGKGIVLTNDGWIAAYLREMPNKSADSGEQEFAGIGIGANGKVYHPVKIEQDIFSDIVFLKIEVSGLSVMPLAELDQTNTAEAIILIGRDSVSAENIDNAAYGGFFNENDYIRSSDSLNRLLLINNNLEGGFLAINLKGELAGIMNTENTAIPAGFINKALKSILKSQKVLRPSLGIEYIDLSSILSIDDNPKINKGALVHKVIPVSAALVAGFVKGDVIIKLENQEVKNNNLPELIQEYDKGVAVNFTVLRGEEDMVISAVLK